MRILLSIWIAVRNAFEASVWATLLWTASESFFGLDWIYLFWAFFSVLFVLSLKFIGVEQWLARATLVIDPILVGLAVYQAVIGALIPAVITIIVGNLISPWTHRYPDWMHVFLFFGCAFYILWRRDGKRKAVQSWQGTPKPASKKSGLFATSPINHLPEWQRSLLADHRRQRNVQKPDSDQVLWTKSPKANLVTELELYWGHVVPWTDGKIAWIVYSKETGAIRETGYNCATEEEAKDSAADYMQYGSPKKAGI